MDAEKLRKAAERKMSQEQWGPAIQLMKSESRVVNRSWKLLWNLGWCHFKLRRYIDAEKYLATAVKLAPKNAVCKWALGMVLLKRRQFRRAEELFVESVRIRESHTARIGLAVACLAQGKIEDAERVHLENIRNKPQDGQRYESYSAFLFDVGRHQEAREMHRKAKRLDRAAIQ